MKSIEKKIYLSLLVCVLISCVGASFAYFSSGIRVNGSGVDTTITTADIIKVTYNAGTSALNLPKAVPGSSANKNFTVSVAPTTAQTSATYAIKLKIDNNTFAKCDSTNSPTYDGKPNNCTANATELKYTLTKDDNTTVTGDLTGKTGTIELARFTKSTNETFTYNLKIEFVNLNSDQNHNKNKTFTGSVEVSLV